MCSTIFLVFQGEKKKEYHKSFLFIFNQHSLCCCCCSLLVVVVFSSFFLYINIHIYFIHNIPHMMNDNDDIKKTTVAPCVNQSNPNDKLVQQLLKKLDEVQ